MKKHQNIYWKGFCELERKKAIYDIELPVHKFDFIINYQLCPDPEPIVSEKHLRQTRNAFKGELHKKKEI